MYKASEIRKLAAQAQPKIAELGYMILVEKRAYERTVNPQLPFSSSQLDEISEDIEKVLRSLKRLQEFYWSEFETKKSED